VSFDVYARLAGQSDRVIETSCAWVFLQKDRALKVKKPVDFGFLDFTTLDKRRWALERELAFNRTTAPDIYRRLVDILDAQGDVAECALEMRRFDPADVLSEHPERLDDPTAEQLGRSLACFHAAAEIRPEGGGTWALGYSITSNAEHLRALKERLPATEIEPLVAGVDAAFAELTPLLEARRGAGYARRCHGDLHLGNILLEHGEPKFFDCIEFNDQLSEIDVLYDAAFLIMDLWRHDRSSAANRALNGYLDEAARAFQPSLWDGLAALPLMLSVRATVRAVVLASEGKEAQARAYLAAATGHLTPVPATLTAIGGLSGSGKTTLARRLAPGLGAAPGAVVLRTDEIRKRLHGAAPLERLPRAAYAPQVSTQVYGEMFDLARRALAAGRAVILDAVFLRSEERQTARTIAASLGVAFDGVWLEADPEQLRQRLASRSGDASDADIRVMEDQLKRDAGPIDWRRLECD
jgi:aminoglycoside phosphotransferase family enzyme/predicted kinase